MSKSIVRGTLAHISFFFFGRAGVCSKDNFAQVAIATVRAHMGLPPGVEIKFIEKKESPVPGFYAVKLSLVTPDREIPAIIYVDKAGEKIFLGNLCCWP